MICHTAVGYLGLHFFFKEPFIFNEIEKSIVPTAKNQSVLHRILLLLSIYWIGKISPLKTKINNDY